MRPYFRLYLVAIVDEDNILKGYADPDGEIDLLGTNTMLCSTRKQARYVKLLSNEQGYEAKIIQYKPEKAVR